MNEKDWIRKLKETAVLVEDYKDEKPVLRLNTPCQIHMTANATEVLRKEYEPNMEKGGILVAIPQRKDGVTHLVIDQIVFLTNVSDSPANKYLADRTEYSQALRDTLGGKLENALPIQFHTHPTKSEHMLAELQKYRSSSNTSKQDQYVSSEFPIRMNGERPLFLPDALVLCSVSMGRLFVGFYNGLIAPVEFEEHREMQTQLVSKAAFDKVAQWSSRKPENVALLAMGGIMLVLLAIKYPKGALTSLFALSAILPMFVNDQSSKPKYFVQGMSGSMTVEIP